MKRKPLVNGDTVKVVSMVKGPLKMSNLMAPVFVRTRRGMSLREGSWIISGRTSCCSQVKMLCSLGYGTRFVQRSMGAQPNRVSSFRALRARDMDADTLRPCGVGKVELLREVWWCNEKRLLSM